MLATSNAALRSNPPETASATRRPAPSSTVMRCPRPWSATPTSRPAALSSSCSSENVICSPRPTLESRSVAPRLRAVGLLVALATPRRPGDAGPLLRLLVSRERGQLHELVARDERGAAGEADVAAHADAVAFRHARGERRGDERLDLAGRRRRGLGRLEG